MLGNTIVRLRPNAIPRREQDERKQVAPFTHRFAGAEHICHRMRGQNLVSLAGMDKHDLYVGDRYGNRVKIEDPQDFLAAFKAAKAVKDPKDVRSEVEAEYVFYSGDSKIYYDAQGKYLILVDKGKKTVYSANMDALLAKVSGLPPGLTPGIEDEEILRLD